MKIAIIGGGFSALSLSHQIISKSNTPLTLYICEQSSHIGLGTAYSTPYPWHLLNVRAAQMGIDSDNPGGFYEWLQNNEDIWRSADPAFQKLAFDKETFLPRKLYGVYLSSLLKDIKNIAKSKNIHFETINKSVTDILESSERTLDIIFSDKRDLKVDKVILATGVQSIKDLSFATSSKRYIPNLWKLEKQDLTNQISNSTKDSVFFIIGTGLTMVDMLSSLDNLNYQGKIIALSRHGYLPETHVEKHLTPLGNLDMILAPKRLSDKLKAFRNELKSIKKDGGHWVQLFETIRPVTPQLWKQLSLQDKKRFLKYCLPLWNKHRHRMPASSKGLIDDLIQKDRLKILSGKIIEIADKNILEVRYKHDESIQTVQTDLIYNCTGPDYNLKQSKSPLIQNLLNQGWITPDSLGLGIKCDSNLKTESPYSKKIYVMGALLFGENFETTAVPDIRIHAQKIASHILLDT